MNPLQLFNTESRRVEEVVGPSIRMYTCGPTIYDFAHIGNFRTYVFEDLLRRTLKFFGYSVLQVMNITDIDDKTIHGATQKGISLKEYTEPYRKAFFEDLRALNIEPVEHYPEATQYLSEMIRLIECLLEKGVAYRSSNESIYFSIQKDPTYGRLSHLKLDELKMSSNSEADEYSKENVADFVLWKAYDPARDGPIYYESPFGPGRPGWHIECSAMAMSLLGPTIDIHCGGVDNIFPHHENEIAQSEACSGKRFVRHWVHAEHLLVDHKKMSKSLGNFYTLRDLLHKGFTGPEVRYLLLSTHYRTQLNFTIQGLEAAKSSLERIGDFIKRIQEIADREQGDGTHQTLFQQADQEFRNALAEDLNISSALARLFELLREVNGLCDASDFSSEDARNLLSLFQQWNQVLAVLPLEEKEERPSSEVMALLKVREQARREKNFSLSDQMREEIAKKGYLIEDTPQGARLKKRP